MIWVIIAGSVAMTDLIFKHYVDRYETMDCHKPLFGGRIYLTKVHNEGLAFGTFKDEPEKVKWAAAAGTGAALGGLARAVFGKGSGVEKLGEALIAGGAVSNAADRCIEHQVTDYIRPNLFGKESRVTFNLADLAVFSGTVLMAADMLGNKKHDSRKTGA